MSKCDEDKRYDYIDRIINNIDFEYIPAEFVRAAEISKDDDSKEIISPDELEEMFAYGDSPSELGIISISIIFDIEKFKQTVVEIQKEILKSASL